ncbi:YifB family Mg chelatase-like AAA ATPase [Naasia aerilata]|uniref:Magnesium chelatase n=1 Tax=Naasia aerilata TaxID=1162966 RepID=A0ABN6XRZ9_9MICO|nr:YifB family Mg chelatase-like AAA ATPase [Naasia aerilata]BDZ46365.1 putative magnesium chelatase [Naasia aerilata]
MAVGRAQSVALVGLAGSLVDVEAELSNQKPGFKLIGLPDSALREAEQRVRAAIANSGLEWPKRKLTVNLSPADLPKQGSGFDLAIAIATLATTGQIPAQSAAPVAHLGELALDGRLRPMRGALPAVLAAARAGARTVLVPSANREEAALVSDIRVVGVASLRDAAIWHGAQLEDQPVDEIRAAVPAPTMPPDGDLADIVGNDDAVEGLVVAAAGGHHLLLVGPPGAGKTMLASRLPTVLPPLDESAALEVTSVRSLSGAAVGGALAVTPPFESPHHTATPAALVGGGSSIIRPGSAARASHGVLFLDEAPEFSSAALETLRQPLESGEITIARANAVARFPARFQLVLAANPCPCGEWGAPENRCTCPSAVRMRYLSKLSGPLLDRIDIRIRVARVTIAQLRLREELPRLDSATARARVADARARAARRLADTPWRTNADTAGPWLRSPAMALGRAVLAPVDRALERGLISMRGYDRVLRIAWTLADLDGVDRPGLDQVGRALLLRRSVP